MKRGKKVGQKTLLCFALLLSAVTGRAENDATSLAKKLQNLVADLYSVPFQNNFI